MIELENVTKENSLTEGLTFLEKEFINTHPDSLKWSKKTQEEFLSVLDLEDRKDYEEVIQLLKQIYNNFEIFPVVDDEFKELIYLVHRMLLEKKKYDFVRKLKNPNINIHLAICTGNYIKLMLDGTKTIESRITKNKSIPYRLINAGDIVILKQSSDKVQAIFDVKKVETYENQELDFIDLKRRYEDQLCISEQWWEAKKNAKYATLIHINHIVSLTPIEFSKKNNRQPWLLVRHTY